MAEQNQRMTIQRRVILEEVRRERSHPTADEVYERVRLRLPRVSLGTVYRNLDRLSREGLITTIEGPGQRRYDGDREDHCHLRCRSCGTIVDVEAVDLPLERISEAVGDFQISGYHLEYYGVCGECHGKGEIRRVMEDQDRGTE